MKRTKTAPSRLAGLFLIFILASCASSAETTGAVKNLAVISASASLPLKSPEIDLSQALFLPEFFKLGLSVPAVFANPGQFMPALVKAADCYNLDFEAPADVMIDVSCFLQMDAR